MVSANMRVGLLVGFGAGITALGVISVVYWPAVFFEQLKKQIVLTEESTSFPIWQETPIPMFLEVFMFNLTNAEEVLADSTLQTKPNFEELGPYVFQELHIKTNLTWHPENATITFYNQRYWHHRPDLSNGSLEDMITSINVIVATVGKVMQSYSYVTRLFVNQLLRSFHENITITKSVSEWVFDGYEDPVIDWALNNSIPFNIPTDKFGWFYGRNGSETFDGEFNMGTGADDINRLGNVERWRGWDYTPFYQGECGKVKGSTGELFPPNYDLPEITIFASDLCTYIDLARLEPVTVQGIEGTIFEANQSVFDNGFTDPSTACFCGEEGDAQCMPRGVLNVSSCRVGAPAFVSFPHFYQADPSYLDKVTGLSPNSNHSFRMALEVLTGIPLMVRAQLQINILLQHVGGMSLMNQFPDNTLVPTFWFRQELEMTEEFAAQARTALRFRYWTVYGLYVIALCGMCVLLAGIIILVRQLLRSPEPPLIVQGSSEDLH